MAGEHNGEPAGELGLQPLPQPGDALDVEPLLGLVEDQQLPGAHEAAALVTPGDVRRISKATEAYYDDTREPPAFSSYLAPPVGWLSDRYYDDNVWLGIELMRTWQLTGDPLALARANEIFDFLITGWDTEGPAPGGIFWVEVGVATTVSGVMLKIFYMFASRDDAGNEHEEPQE